MTHNITLSISDELFGAMKRHSEIKWSEVARKAISERVEWLDRMNTLASKSGLSEKDAFEIGEKIKTGIAKRHGIGT